MGAPFETENAAKEAVGQVQASSSKKQIATELQIRDTIATIREALNRRAFAQPNIWAFFSNKNSSLLTIEGDLYFIACVLFEGDSAVSNYVFEPSKNTGSRSRILVTTSSGEQKCYVCSAQKSREGQGATSQASEPDSPCITLTEQDLAPRMVEFSSWLTLCGAMTRARDFSTAAEVEVLLDAIKSSGSITFREAMALPNMDPALMLSSVAKGLATGALVAEIRSTPLDLDTLVFLGSDEQKVASKIEKTSSNQNGSRSASYTMPRNRRTCAHPELFACPGLWLDEKWLSKVSDESQRQRSKAVHMYLFNRPYSEIRHETGFSASWVRKLFHRTLASNGDKPIGLAGLTTYIHLKTYERKSDLPKGNLEEGKKGGYAGAFSNLIAAFPSQLFELIEGEVLRKHRDIVSGETKIREARVSWIDLHGRVKEFLRSNGLGDGDYPFNTRDIAYSSLVTLCNAILFNRPINWIESRGGKDALRRARIGSGKSSLIQAQYINQIVELDFQKCDSAAVIEVCSPKGMTIDVPVARWWAGAMVEAFTENVIATSDSFEAQTTEDCVMDLLSVAISPPSAQEKLARFKNCADGVWLPSQMIPEYSGQAWDILKLDRAWAHKSTTVLSAAIATIGCAVCFGAPRAWFARHLIERTFGKLTQAGPQALPSTLGVGPQDTQKNDPDAQAIRYRFMQDDVCDLIRSSARWANETGNEGTFWAPPLDILKKSMAGGAIRFFPRPLPLARKTDNPLMWKTMPRTVEGSAINGVAPFVRTSTRVRFRGPNLQSTWSLIGDGIYLQVFRHDIRKARVLSGNGMLVDDVRPEDKWMSTPISWRDHALIQKFGKIQKHHDRSPTPVHDFVDVKKREVTNSKTKIGQKKRDAAAIAQIERNAMRQREAEDIETSEPIASSQRTAYSSILGPAPQLGTIRRGERRG